MSFDGYKSPRLPFPQNTYDQTYFNQLTRNLTGYFNVVDSGNPITTDKISAGVLRLPITELGITTTTNNDLKIPAATFIRLTADGVAANFNITGLDSGYTASAQSNNITNDGRVVILYNSLDATYTMSIHNQDTGSSAENRIITGAGSGSGGNLNNVHIITLIYSVKDLRWLVLAHQP